MTASVRAAGRRGRFAGGGGRSRVDGRRALVQRRNMACIADPVLVVQFVLAVETTRSPSRP